MAVVIHRGVMSYLMCCGEGAGGSHSLSDPRERFPPMTIRIKHH